MSKIFEHGAEVLPVDAKAIRAKWAAEGFSFGIFRDPPNEEWNDFVHDTDEYVLVAEGTLTISVGDQISETGPGDLVRIPKHMAHSLKTTSPECSVWFYGYGHWSGT